MGDVLDVSNRIAPGRVRLMRFNIGYWCSAAECEVILMDTLSYNYLYCLRKKGFRNGNWRKLSRIEKALYVASLSLAKMRGRLVNSRLVLELMGIIGRLKDTAGERLMRVSYERAVRLYERFTAVGLFEWAPQVRSWFNDPSYVLWLGLCSPEHFPC